MECKWLSIGLRHGTVSGFRASALVLFLLAAGSLAGTRTAESEAATAVPPLVAADTEVAPAPAPEKAPPNRWFLLLAWVNVYPKLESEKLVDKYFDPAMRFFAPGYDDVFTISDLRDKGLLWPPHFGIGYVLSPKWSVFFQSGYTVGKVRTEADDRSILLLPLHTDFEIQRGAAFFGVGVDFFPLGGVEMKRRKGLRQRLQDAKPSLGARYTYTYATYDAKVKAGFKPLPNIGVRLSDSWFLPSVNLNLGFDIPLDERNLLFCNAGYAFFWEQEHDFSGPAFTIGWKHFFR